MKKIHFVILAELIIMFGCMFLCTLRIVGVGSLYGFTPVGVEIPVDDSSYGDFIHRERGIGLMARMKIPDGDVSLAYSSWSFPTSIIVNEVSYRVKQISQDGWFKICSQTNSEDVLASGGLCRTTNAKIARVCGFGEIALNSLPLGDLARQVRVLPLDSSTNALYLASTHSTGERLEVLIARNYFLFLRGGTNNFECALSVMNAGLPYGERIRPHLQQPQP